MAGELGIAPPSPALPAMRLLQRPRLPTQGLSSLCRRALLLPRCPPTASSSSTPGSHDACAPSMTTSAGGGSGATQQPRLPPRALLDALAAYPAITVAQFPGSGRGLMAATDISYGETILMEQPLLCFQSAEMADQVCYGCLSVLGTHNMHLTSPLSGRHFCSEACMGACEARWHAMESLAMGGGLVLEEQPGSSSSSSSSSSGGVDNSSGMAGGSSSSNNNNSHREARESSSSSNTSSNSNTSNNNSAPNTSGTSTSTSKDGGCITADRLVSQNALAAFESLCQRNGERFPLMAARMAFARLTRAVTQQQQHPHDGMGGALESSSSGSSSSGGSGGGGGRGGSGGSSGGSGGNIGQAQAQQQRAGASTGGAEALTPLESNSLSETGASQRSSSGDGTGVSTSTSSTSTKGGSGSGSSASASVTGAKTGISPQPAPGRQYQRYVVAGDPVSDLQFLCFARVSKPYPKPWVELYGLLQQAMQAAVREAGRQLLSQEPQPPQPPPQQPPAQQLPQQPQQSSQQQAASVAQQRVAALHSELQQLSLDWFVSVLARLHINVFRVGCLVSPDSLPALARGGGDGGGDGGERGGAPRGGLPFPGLMSSGSAAYLVASLFNHSCEPNVEVVFRRNDATAAFVAARDIDKGEQLFVSYLDETLPLKLRQQHLEFAYGFCCRCQRCVEEEQDGAA